MVQNILLRGRGVAMPDWLRICVAMGCKSGSPAHPERRAHLETTSVPFPAMRDNYLLGQDKASLGNVFERRLKGRRPERQKETSIRQPFRPCLENPSKSASNLSVRIDDNRKYVIILRR